MAEYKTIEIDEIVNGKHYYVKYQPKDGEPKTTIVTGILVHGNRFESKELSCPLFMIVCLYPVLSIDEASIAINGKPMDEHEDYEKYKSVWFEAFKRVNKVAVGIGAWGFGKASQITRRQARKKAKALVERGVISELDYKLAVLGEKDAIAYLRDNT